MRVFLDANVLFSAAKTDGAVRALVSLLRDRGHECRADAYVVAKARRNLVSKGPQAVQVLDALLAHLHIAPAVAAAVEAVELDWLASKDRPVLAGEAHALFSGDRDLLALAGAPGLCPVRRVQDFCEQVLGD